MKITIFSFLFLSQFTLMTHAANTNQLECYVFINGAVSEQLGLFFTFNEEYYLSRSLHLKSKITFINISNQRIPNAYLIPIINDTEGVWVRKFKPQTLPTVFSINQHKNLQRVIATTSEIRQCLQGK